MMSVNVVGKPAYLLFASVCVVPVPHHVVFLVAVVWETVKARPVSFVCQVVAFGVALFQFVLSVIFVVLSESLSMVDSVSFLFTERV